MGTTDSEAALCEVLETLCLPLPPTGSRSGCRQRRRSRPGPPRLSELGAFNFLLSDGERLFAHCSTKLAYIERRAPFTKARLIDTDLEVDFAAVTTPKDRVGVIATAPLTDNERWVTLPAGQVAVFNQGRRM